ncbi:ff506abd-d5cd-416c-b2f4-22fcf6f5667b [Sclerotinia trifoliorum]|uniref:Ff506abd-d5cd-416c-b2f4-22fcf6f5667b n=1 Tax=Sclerotinia trifoliorum TaxID=28548 RepID=A0A8H2W214_9HELO|nr:ff506abd-d5cd-416c-b2f4-22fcf6f5667b [Sclerotinia trifoliorum]
MGFFAAILSLISTGQIAFTGYNLYLSSIAIPKLLTYENKAIRAAKYSNIAEEQLFKTRTTQAASVGALILTLSTATPFLLLNYTSSTIFALSTVNLAVLLGTRKYVGDFWKGKPKMPIPGTGDFNDAIGLTNEVRENQLFLAMSWVLYGVLGLLV